MVSNWIIENTPEGASFLSSALVARPATIQNPIVTGAGRKSAVGFITWLYTHGIDYVDRLNDIDSFFADPAKAAPAEYLIIDETLKRAYPGVEEKVKSGGFRAVYEDGQYSIIQLFTP